MSDHNRVVYEFSGFRLEPASRSLLRRGTPVALTPKAFDTLVFLVQNPGRLLEKDELMQALWSGDFVEESNLSHNIFILRKALGHNRNGNSFIQTIPRRGYQFVAQVTEIAAAEAENSSLTEYWRTHSPFRSLQVFAPEDAWLFFGRDQEIHELLARLRRSPILVMVGNSGCGKSSLLRAGLIAALRAGRVSNGGPQDVSSEAWRIALLRPSAAPFDYLTETLPGQLAPELLVKDRPAFTAEWRSKLLSGGDTLRNAIRALVNAVPGKREPAPVLLVVDQFEEIFTLTGRQEVRDRYINALLAAAHRDSAMPVHLVLALRADFYGHCLEHAGLSRCLENNLHNVPRMTPEQLRETIEKRLQLAGGDAEAGLISALLEDAGEEPGNLALLEHTLAQLWDECAGSGGTLTNQAYEKIGRLRGALGRHADSIYRGLGDEEQKDQVRKIFLELVHLGEGAQDTRRRLRKESLLGLGAPEEIERLLGVLASSRLISISREGEETFVEVSHEALIREWPALREWLSQNREELSLERRLLQTAEEWESLQRDPSAVLQGARLAQAEDWLGRQGNAPDPVQQFVQASIDARAEATHKERLAHQRELAGQAAAARRSRLFSYGLTALLVLAAGLAWFAYHQQVLEKSRKLAAQSAELLPRDHGRALELALDSWRTAKTEEAHFAVAKAFPELVAVLKHDGPVTVTMFSPDGQRIVSASWDHTARLWSAADGHLLFTLQGHTDKVNYARFSPDGSRVVTASFDGTARLWSTADGRLLCTFKGHAAPLLQAAFSANGKLIATASADRTARVWNTDDGRLLSTLSGHSKLVSRAEFSNDGQHMVTASYDGTARIWNTADGHLVTTLRHNAEVYYAQFFPDDHRVITASFDNTARIWNATDGALLLTLHHDGLVIRAVPSPDGERIVTISFDHTARVWNSADGRLLFILHHDGVVSHAEFSSDGRRIVTASFDHIARVWSALDGRLLASLEGNTGVLYHASFSPSGQRIVTGGSDGTVKIWSVAMTGLPVSLRGHTNYVFYTQFSPDGQSVVTGSEDKTARVWSTVDGRLRAILQGHTNGIAGVQFSPDGQRIVTASRDHTARVWNSADGRLLLTLQGHTDQVWDAQFSPDGQRIVTGSNDHTARVWNTADGQLLLTLQGHTARLNTAQFSPDGQRIVTASDDHTAKVWDSADGQLLLTLQGHTAEVRYAQFSPDGQRILTASYDHTARVWNSANGQLLLTLQGHTGVVWSAEFSPDGQRIATASADRTARVWSSADGQLLLTLQGHTGEVQYVQFSRDGRRIVTGGWDPAAKVWNSADGLLLATLQGRTDWVWGPQFSPEGQHVVTGGSDPTACIWHFLTLDDIEKILAR